MCFITKGKIKCVFAYAGKKTCKIAEALINQTAMTNSSLHPFP